jgi:hypothetical protein
MTVKVIDRGWKRIVREFKKADGAYVKVGVLQDAGQYLDSENPQTIADVATANEFGVPSKGIPARPFMAKSYDMNKEELDRFKRHTYSQVLQGRYSMEKFLGLMGALHEGQIKKTIVTPGLFEPNAPMTVAMKRSKGKGKRGRVGRIMPLVDTGQMREKIAYEVKI